MISVRPMVKEGTVVAVMIEVDEERVEERGGIGGGPRAGEGRNGGVCVCVCVCV